MKKILFVIAVIVGILGIAGLSSCRRWSDNGKIDGYWQIQEVYYIADGTTSHPTELFIAVQLELLQLQQPMPSGDLTAVLAYNKNEDFFTVDFRNNPSDAQLYPFGFAGAQERIDILKADDKHLILSTPIARITCRKY